MTELEQATGINLSEAYVAAVNENELLRESLADLQLAAEDRGWRLMSSQLEQQFTREGLADIARNCTVMAIASPLIKRGLQLRTGYVWGQGVQIQARAGSDADQDVNAVVQAFWDDPANQKSLTTAQAQEQNERALGTDGNWFLAFFPDPATGRVQVRTVPFTEVQDKWTNPEDRDEDWFFLRQYEATVVESGAVVGTTRSRRETRRVLHPALGHRPARRPRMIDGLPVMWDQPILHVAVNRPSSTWKWGIPDAYAALPWARAYEEFLTDWARLVKALSKFAWRLSGDKGSKVQRAASKIASALPLPTEAGGSNAGAVAAMGPGATLEAIPKSGATIDSESGKPLATMVAAALGLPVTTLLADPGVTGARAVAETLDKPTVLEMGTRQQLWASVLQTVLSYVVDQAVLAPAGPLKGTTGRDAQGRQVITLAGEVERTVEVTFPDLVERDSVQLVNAIVAADTTGKLPAPWVVKALLRSLGEKDVDEILEGMLDEDGNWVDPLENAGQAAVDAARRGEDAAEAWR